MPLDETPLFEPALLRELDWSGGLLSSSSSSSSVPSSSPAVSPSEPGPGLLLRPLCTADLHRGFFEVLSQLTRADDVTPDQFVDGFERMKRTGDYYVVVVVEDSEDSEERGGRVVATATLITEHKFIRSCAKRGRVEEVVVSDAWRGKQLGRLLVSTLTLLGRKLGCYKVTLECSPDNVPFYQKVGYAASDETYMQCRFHD